MLLLYFYMKLHIILSAVEHVTLVVHQFTGTFSMTRKFLGCNYIETVVLVSQNSLYDKELSRLQLHLNNCVSSPKFFNDKELSRLQLCGTVVSVPRNSSHDKEHSTLLLGGQLYQFTGTFNMK